MGYNPLPPKVPTYLKMALDCPIIPEVLPLLSSSTSSKTGSCPAGRVGLSWENSGNPMTLLVKGSYVVELNHGNNSQRGRTNWMRTTNQKPKPTTQHNKAPYVADPITLHRPHSTYPGLNKGQSDRFAPAHDTKIRQYMLHHDEK